MNLLQRGAKRTKLLRVNCLWYQNIRFFQIICIEFELRWLEQKHRPIQTDSVADMSVIVWEPPPFDQKGSFAYVLAKYLLFVYTRLRVDEAAAEKLLPCTNTQLLFTCVTLTGCDGMKKLSETFSSTSSSSSLPLFCPRVWHALTSSSLPCSFIHLPARLRSCHVSTMMQPLTNEMR